MKKEAELVVDRLWTVKDAAEYLRVSVSLVYKRAEAGQMPSIKLGSVLRFEPSAVRAWAQGLAVNEVRHD